jgi:hypothetical protein
MARDSRRIPCAVESHAREEPLHGTASRVRRWLLVEQPGPWGRDALRESRLDSLVARSLLSYSRRYGFRVVFVRRPKWRTEETRHVFLVRSDPRRGWIERFDITEDRDLLRVDLGALAEEEAPGIGAPGPSGLYLVCTNGRHDQCCADLGRPVIRALDAAGATDVWESSHVGGDRFAANVVCLPTGVYYGRVPPDRAARILDDLAAGVIDLDCYRGRSCYPPLVQAAEAFVRRELDERRLTALRVASVVPKGANDVTVVLVHADGERVAVTVQRRRGPEERLTCSESGVSRPWTYHVVSLSRQAV